ncbi:MAG: hypothetical protein H6Q89_1980, partial [Myxococcaceae bacterium]|nr:hypothetical protein [Myxococcaceae bacterium]
MKPLAPLLLLLSGCALFNPVTIARDTGQIGWFQADEHLQWVPVEQEQSCEAIAAKVREGPVVVFVPGVRGAGEEINAMLPRLARTQPSSFFLYRWVPWVERDAITRGFAAGISHLLDCVPWIDGRLLVVAHSAGGVVVGYGATWLDVPRRDRKGPALYVLTVAAPLAGMEEVAPKNGGPKEAPFILDFGTRIDGYPVSPSAMAAVHLRTQYPGDPVMRVRSRLVPNDPTVGFPGARQIDLPAALSHDGAMKYVLEKIADGSWRAWFDETGPSLRSDLLEKRH